VNAIMRREPPEPVWQVLARHWQNLTPTERQRLRELLSRSRGRPRNLNRREQQELRELVDKLDAPALARELYSRREQLRRIPRPRIRRR
jgi:Spy/CpxP family protein refolding chaperone